MPVSDAVPLDVCLNDGRDYVQGSQMIARAADALGRLDGLRLRSAQFHDLTAGRVGLRLGERRSGDLGEVSFEAVDGPVQAAFEPLGGRAPAGSLRSAARASDPVIDVPAQAGRIRFEGAVDLRDVLDLAVQLTKRLHQTLTPGARDVWLTGVRNADLSAPWRGPSSGDLHVQVTRRLVTGQRVQSVNRLRLEPEGRAVAQAFVLTFAHREEG